MYFNTSPLSRLLLWISINLLSISGFQIVPCDKVIELISIPSKFEGVNIPAKIRVIPAPGQTRIDRKVSTQFWVKNIHDFDIQNPILSYTMNKDFKRYVKVYNDPSSSYASHASSWKKVYFKISEPHMFRVWSRITVDIETNYPVQNENGFNMTVYVDGLEKSKVHHI